jgi:hypothetical protein
MIPLNNVTLISINGKDPDNSVKAINYSSRRINFAKKILVTTKNKIKEHEGIELIEYDIKNRDTYSYFCIKELYKYIDTEFCLVIQPDGFVINPFAWSDSFLDWDYIGAPLVPRETEHALLAYDQLKNGENHKNLPYMNGCGGFTLRSKKFLLECSKLEYPPNKIYTHNTLAEDFFLCIYKKLELEQKGIRFAPIDIASTFATAWGFLSMINYTFGFHGAYPKPIKDKFLNLLDNPENEIDLDIYKNLKHFIKL